MSKGNLIIISGPSGCGKDTVLKELFKKMPELSFSISSVSRAMREGEVAGEKYNFIKKEEFEALIKEDAFLEYNVFCGNYYGTPKKPVFDCIENGKEIVLEVDVNGADNVRKRCKDNFSIFILPPSIKTLEGRLRGRGTETEEKILSRLGEAKREINSAYKYDYTVVNDDLAKCVDDICNIILSERMRSDRNESLIKELLK